MAAAHGVETVSAAALLYRDNTRTIYSGLHAFLNDPRLSDMVLVRPDGRAMHVHQVILAACSRKFASVLSNGDATGKELPIQGVDSGALESVVSFFYRGECLLSPTTVVPILDVCLKLEVPGLGAGCEQYIQQNMNPQTCAIFLDAAVQLTLEPTVKTCLAYAKSRFDDVVSTSAFQSLSIDTVRLLLSHTRSAVGDVGMARALARWAVRRPEHLADCEGLFKELNVTTTELLHLLQSPELLQSLQTGRDDTRPAGAVGTAAAVGAGSVAGGSSAREQDPAAYPSSFSAGAAAGAAPGSAAGSGGAAAATGRVSVTGSGLGGGHAAAGGSAAAGPGSGPYREKPAAEPQQPVLFSIQTGLGPALIGTSAQGRQLGSPELDSECGRNESGQQFPAASAGDGGVGANLALKQAPKGFGAASGLVAALPVGERLTLGLGAKWSPAIGPASAPAAGGPLSTVSAARAGGAPPPLQQPQPPPQPSLQQQLQPPNFQRRSLPTAAELAALGGASAARPERASMPPQTSEGGGWGGMAAAAGAASALAGTGGRYDEPSEGAVRRRGDPLPSSQPVTVDALAAAARAGLAGVVGLGQQALGPARGLVADSAITLSGTADGGVLAVPLSVMEQADMTIHLLPSGVLVASGGALGPQQLPLQVVTGGSGAEAQMLALLPLGLLSQAQVSALQQDAGDAAQEVPLPGEALQLQQPPAQSRRGAGAARGGPPASAGLGRGASATVAALEAALAAAAVASGGGRAQLMMESAAAAAGVADAGTISGSGGASGAGGSSTLSGQARREALEAAEPALEFQALGGLPHGPVALLPSRLVSSGRSTSTTSLLAGGLGGAGTGGGGGALTAAAAAAAAAGRPRSVSDMLSAGAAGAGTLQRGRSGAFTGPTGQYQLGGAADQPGGPRWPAGDMLSMPVGNGDGPSGAAGPAAAAGAAGAGGSVPGKRRRQSPDHDDPDHVEEGGGRGGSGGGGGNGAVGRGGRSGQGARAGAGGDGSGPGGHTGRGPLMCHVDDCHVELSNLKEYHQRFRICDFHLKAEVVIRDGTPQRFCQQCGRFHVLTEFDGTKRSCRARLQRHNARRRKRPDQQRGSGGDGGSDEPRKSTKGFSPQSAGGSQRSLQLQQQQLQQQPSPAPQQFQQQQQHQFLLGGPQHPGQQRQGVAVEPGGPGQAPGDPVTEDEAGTDDQADSGAVVAAAESLKQLHQELAMLQARQQQQEQEQEQQLPQPRQQYTRVLQPPKQQRRGYAAPPSRGGELGWAGESGSSQAEAGSGSAAALGAAAGERSSQRREESMAGRGDVEAPGDDARQPQHAPGPLSAAPTFQQLQHQLSISQQQQQQKQQQTFQSLVPQQQQLGTVVVKVEDDAGPQQQQWSIGAKGPGFGGRAASAVVVATISGDREDSGLMARGPPLGAAAPPAKPVRTAADPGPGAGTETPGEGGGRGLGSPDSCATSGEAASEAQTASRTLSGGGERQGGHQAAASKDVH